MKKKKKRSCKPPKRKLDCITSRETSHIYAIVHGDIYDKVVLGRSNNKDVMVVIACTLKLHLRRKKWASE